MSDQNCRLVQSVEMLGSDRRAQLRGRGNQCKQDDRVDVAWQLC